MAGGSGLAKIGSSEIGGIEMSENMKTGNMAADASVFAAQSICNSMIQPHDYREIKTGENTKITIDLEDLKKQLVQSHFPSCFMTGV